MHLSLVLPRHCEERSDVAIHFKKSHIHCIMIYKMKRLISTILFLLLTSPFCFCLSDFQFSVAPRVSLSFGELNEILYGSDDTIVSQLDWEQNALFNYGMEANIKIYNFNINSIFESSLPLGTSYMYDYDDFDGNKTVDKLSKHPIKQTTNLNTELTLSYDLQWSSVFTVLPLINFQYLFNDFKSDKGDILFGQRTPGKKVYANKIDYYRHSVFIFSGVGIKISPQNKLLFTLDFQISPWGYQFDYDYHHGTGKDPRYPFSTYDYMYSFFSKAKFNITTSFLINSFLSIQLFTNSMFGFPDKGECYTDFASEDYYLSSRKSGANINYIKTGISLKITF